jgi:hypothetical protein
MEGEVPMSTSGTMIAAYTPQAINNITEEIWMQGGTIPQGKRVLIGIAREGGWVDITFQMGNSNQFTGMATVPASYVRADGLPASLAAGVGQRASAMLPGVLRARGREGVGDLVDVIKAGTSNIPLSSSTFACPPGYKWSAQYGCQPIPKVATEPNPSSTFTVPPCPPGYELHVRFGQHTEMTYAEWLAADADYRRAMGSRFTFVCRPLSETQKMSMPATSRATSMLPELLQSAYASSAPARMGPVNPVSSGTERMGPVNPVSAPGVRQVIYPYYRRAVLGLGAAGASEFTMKAAEELDEHLTTNGCAGCGDYKSTLRQLAFKFKAACMTDPAIQNQVSFNMDTALSMTAFGSGTNKALSLVLGSKRTYEGVACTDDAGNCLGVPQISSVIPVAMIPLIEQVAKQIKNAIANWQGLPPALQLDKQKPIVEMLAGAVGGLLAALSAALYTQPGPGPGPQQQPPLMPSPTPPTPPTKTEEKKTPWGAIAIGGALLVGGAGTVWYLSKGRA